MTAIERPPHHHGNLRPALIAAGIALLQEEGPSGLTLRRAAARAGVSHAAPAHHFQGLSGLLTAIATEAFTRFTAAMVARRNAASPDAFAQLLAIADGYLDFARDHDALFQIMFTTPEVDRLSPPFGTAAMASYNVLRDACLPFAVSEAPDRELEHAVWCLIHGYALLGMAKAQPPDSPRHEAPPFERHLRRLLHLPSEAACP